MADALYIRYGCGAKPDTLARLAGGTHVDRVENAHPPRGGGEGGRPRLIDREKMLALRAARKLHREIAEELGVSMASVAGF